MSVPTVSVHFGWSGDFFEEILELADSGAWSADLKTDWSAELRIMLEHGPLVEKQDGARSADANIGGPRSADDPWTSHTSESWNEFHYLLVNVGNHSQLSLVIFKNSWIIQCTVTPQ